MFGNKRDKRERLERIAESVRNAENGRQKVDLARELGVSRSTITKDMGIVEKVTGALFYEDEDERIFWFGRKSRKDNDG